MGLSRFLLTVLAALLFLIASGQEIFYKDEWRRKATKEKNASYKLVVTAVNDSVTTKKFMTLDGQLLWKRSFRNGIPAGKWETFDRNGKVVKMQDFSVLKYGCDDEGSTSSPTKQEVTGFDKVPQFRGGESEMFKFLGQNVKYPQEAADVGISGVVYVQGNIDEQGNSTRICEGIHPFLDLEACRVLDIMPPWEPVLSDGKAKAMRYVLPIRFTLR